MNRRHFLPVAAAAATGTGLLGYYAWDQAAAGSAQRRDEAPARPLAPAQLPADARRILYLAALAPSGHNTQPWTVRLLGPYHWIIGNDPRGWLPVVDPTQRELAHWVRWDAAAMQRHRDGLTAAGMGIEGPAGWLVRHLYDSAHVLTPDFRARGLAKVADQLATHGGWLVLTSPDESVPALLAAGRRLARIWLRAKALNVAIHPMTQVLEEVPGPAGLGQQLGLDAPVQFVLRLGYVESYAAPVSPRRPVEWFVRA